MRTRNTLSADKNVNDNLASCKSITSISSERMNEKLFRNDFFTGKNGTSSVYSFNLLPLFKGLVTNVELTLKLERLFLYFLLQFGASQLFLCINKKGVLSYLLFDLLPWTLN